MTPTEAAPPLARVDRRLTNAVIAFDDWETPLRMRLQLQVAADRDVTPETVGPAAPDGPGRAAGTHPRATATRARIIEWAGAAGVIALLGLDMLLVRTKGSRRESRSWHPARDLAACNPMAEGGTTPDGLT
ncbi:MAG: hypothetical protein U0667_00185 [Chloroflexota bacterium]